MSSKRKSPPTKHDGSNGVSDLSIHHPDSHHHLNHLSHHSLAAAAAHHHLDLSIKTEEPDLDNRVSSQQFDDSFMNGDRLKVKRNFHEQNSHSLQNILSKRRKSENFTNDNVPTLLSSTSPHQHSHLNHNHHGHLTNNHNSSSFSRIKCEEQQNGSEDDDEEVTGEDHCSNNNNNNNNNHSEIELKKELLVPSKKTMNDVLKLLTNKMRGSTLKDGSRKSSVDGDGDGKR